MFADVIPFTRIPKLAQAFTYRIPDELSETIRVGHFVLIPWRGSKQFGVVQKISQTTTISKTSALLALAEQTPSWSTALLHTLTTFADLYHVSWSLMAYTFAPTIPKRGRKMPPTSNTANASLRAIPELTLSRASVPVIQQLARTEAQQSIYKFRQHGERLYFYRELCAAASHSILFLVPQLDDAQELYDFLAKYYPHDIVQWESGLAANEQWRRWEASKTAKIVISTRSGAFLPSQQLSLIVLDQDDQPEHKQWEASPHYDARSCAAMRAQSEGLRIVRTAVVPRIESSALDSLTVSESPLLPIHTISYHGRDLLHPDFIEAMQSTLERGKSCLIICTHKGESRIIRCLDCQHRWMCPQCHVSLYEHQDALRCPVCAQSQPRPLSCPSCHSQTISSFGPGIQKVTSYLQKTLASPVYTWDADHVARPDDKTPHVVVSTPYACKPLLRDQAYALLGLFHPESILFQLDYRANEHYYHLIQWHRVRFEGKSKNLLIQTSLPPENALHQIVVQDKYRDFYQQEFSLRSQLSYPPKSFILKYIYRGQDQAEVSAIESRLKAHVPGLIGPFKQHQPAATYWIGKQKSLANALLDNTNDSLYNKLVLDINPHHL